MELLKKLYSIWSPSRNEGRMISYLSRYCKSIPGTTVTRDRIGNLYIVKGESETYPCIVAHIDQVQERHSKDFKVLISENIIIGYSPKEHQQQGLGADDKNGIWIALKCLRKYPVLKVAFFVGEEIGCIGSSNADMDFFNDCRFVIQCDRRGNGDFIYDISGVELCSEDFINDCRLKEHGYEPTDGLSTDVCELKEQGLKVSCCNMSCGYYSPHTDHEFTDRTDLLKCKRLVEDIIENCTRVYSHENSGYTGISSMHGLWDFEDESSECYDEFFCIIESNPQIDFEQLYHFYKSYYYHLSRQEMQDIFNQAEKDVKSCREMNQDDKQTL